MERKVLLYKDSTIVYYQFGTGRKPVICFHGYDEQADKYDFLEKYAGHQFRFYAFDLPYHGDSEWREGFYFKPADLKGMIELFVETEFPSNPGESSISILAFSLGSRVALSLYELLPSRFDKLVLLAPDGFKVNSWYWFTTQTGIGNRIFDLSMMHPGGILSLLKVAGRLRILNASVMKFCRYYLRDKKMSRLLYQRWTGLSLLKPDLKLIRSLIAKHNTAFTLVYGNHDRIIRPGNGEKFCEGLGPNCRLRMLDAGHMLFNEKHITEILACFSNK